MPKGSKGRRGGGGGGGGGKRSGKHCTPKVPRGGGGGGNRSGKPGGAGKGAPAAHPGGGNDIALQEAILQSFAHGRASPETDQRGAPHPLANKGANNCFLNSVAHLLDAVTIYTQTHVKKHDAHTAHHGSRTPPTLPPHAPVHWQHDGKTKHTRW